MIPVCVMLTLVLLGGHGSLGAPMNCTDEGKSYSNGEEYTKGSFKFRCNAGEGFAGTEILACIWSKTGEDVKVGGVAESNGTKFFCEKGNNGAVSYRTKGKQMKCKDGNRTYGNDEVYTKGAFKKRCNASEYWALTETIACIWTKTGEEVKVGGEAKFESWTFLCKKGKNGGVSYEEKSTNGSQAGPQMCKSHNGKKYNKGDVFKEGNYKYKCVVGKNWSKSEIIACIVNNTLEIIVNTERKDGDLRHSCTKTQEGKVEYRSDPIKK